MKIDDKMYLKRVTADLKINYSLKENIVVKALCNALRGRHKYGAQHEVNIPRGAAQ